MPEPIKYAEPVRSLLRNGELKSVGVRLLEYGNEISVCAVRADGNLATGHIGLHPDAVPDLIAQLVAIHCARRPGEADLVRAMVENAIPETPQLSDDEIDLITGPKP